MKAINGINILKKYNIPISSRVTVFKKNVSDLEAVSKLLLEGLGVPMISFDWVNPIGHGQKYAEIIRLSNDELTQTMDTLILLNEKYKERITAVAGPLFMAKAWNSLKERTSNNGPRFQGGFLSPCLGLLLDNKICVRSDGVFVSCLLMNHNELGHISKDDIMEIWQNHPELKRLRERGSIPLSKFEFCKGCEYINHCCASCPAQSYAVLKDAYQPCSENCLRRFLLNGGKLPDRKTIAFSGSSCDNCID